MSQTFAQFVPANASRTPAVGQGDSASAPLLNPMAEKARSILHLEIRRSLQVRRRLAVGLALVGLALALIYLLNSWTMLTAPNPTETQSQRLSQVEEPRIGGITAMIAVHTSSAPGFPGLAASIVSPWYWDDSGVIRNALVLLLSFVFLGGAIAVVAHRADPRVYVSSDVEQILGFPPMAQLPDFSEVADEIADKHLLRLASGIDVGFKDRGFKRCVLTGTGPEVGVSTVAKRLKTILETMGRAATVVNAAADLDLEVGIHSESVLIDAAPLADSEKAERLVQAADCTIVIIESGVTTRAQLRTVANILQRIKAPAVGFVLNRVHLATADPEFRRSIREMGKQLRKQGQATDWQMLQTLEQAIEEGRASLDLDAPFSPIRLGESRPEQIATSSPIEEFADATKPATADGHGLQLVKRALPEPTNRQGENPLLLAATAPQLDRPAESKAEQKESLSSGASGMNELGTGSAQASPTPERPTRVQLPRLSDLRGMRFSQAIRELDLAKRPASPTAGVEALMSAIAPFEPMFTQSEPEPTKNEDPPQAAPGEFDLPASLRGFIPIAESGVSPEANGKVSGESSANGNQAPTNSFLPKPAEQPRNTGGGGESSEGSGPAQKAPQEKLSGPFEQVQILPSRRGQYKKKA